MEEIINQELENLNIEEEENQLKDEIKNDESHDDDKMIIETNEDKHETTKKCTSIQVFGAIVDFVSSLSENYGKTYHNLALYSLLLERTGIYHTEQVEKHISIFRTFLLQFQEEIKTNKLTDMTEYKISYSEKIFIDITSILSSAKEDDLIIIREHLLTLLCLICPETQAKSIILRENEKHNLPQSPIMENNLMSNIFSSISKQVENKDASNLNPTEILGDMISNGTVNEIFQSLSSSFSSPESAGGTGDISNMVTGIQGLLGQLNNSISQLPEQSKKE